MSFEREVASPLASESGLSAIRDLEHEFGRAFAQAELYGARLDDRLRHVIHRVVDEAKASGKTADDIVAMIRDLARRGGFARPDAVRPVSSFPADRLLTKAITACIERYHEADEPPPTIAAQSVRFDLEDIALIANGADARGAVSARLRALVSPENESAFVSALALFVRSTIARGWTVDQALAGINRIVDAIGDGPMRATADAPARGGKLVIRGLLEALYEGHEQSTESEPPVHSPYLKPVDRPITNSR